MIGSGRVIEVTIDRGTGRNGRLVTYEVPVQEGESVLGVLQYIYENLDPGLTFYSSCRIGLCTGCLVRVNGKAVLACTAMAEDKMLIEPHDRDSRVRDLVVLREPRGETPNPRDGVKRRKGCVSLKEGDPNVGHRLAETQGVHG